MQNTFIAQYLKKRGELFVELNESNYYGVQSNLKYFSASQYKQFQKCEAMAMAEIKGEYEREKSDALLLGSFVDEVLTGTNESYSEFINENYSRLFKKNGEPRAEIEKAMLAVEKVKQQPLMMHLLSGEHQTIMTGEIGNVPVKIKMDSYKPGEFIADLKYMKSLRSPNLFDSMVKYWGYDTSMAIYQEIVYQNTGERLPVYLVIATKETPCHLEVCEIKQYDLDEALDNVKKNIKRYHLIKTGEIEPERCEEYDCAYCTETRILTEPIDSNLLGMTRKEI